MTSNANAKENNDEGKQANHNGAKIFENWHRFFNLTAERRVRRRDFIKVLAGSAAVTGSPQLG